MEAIIYKITNDINSKVYVGQTWQTAESRFNRHCAEARWNNVKNMPVVLAIRKYGPQHFQVETLERLDSPGQSVLDEREIYWGTQLSSLSPNGYNLRLGQANGRWSEETKRKIGLGNKGKKRTAETIENLRISHLGHKVKDSTKLKLSKINEGKKLSPAHAAKIAASNTGKRASEKAREKMSCRKLKYLYTVISPSGEIFTTTNLCRFSIDRGLNRGHMGSVALGNKKHHQGWTVTRISNVSTERKEEAQDQPQQG